MFAILTRDLGEYRLLCHVSKSLFGSNYLDLFGDNIPAVRYVYYTMCDMSTRSYFKLLLFVFALCCYVYLLTLRNLTCV